MTREEIKSHIEFLLGPVNSRLHNERHHAAVQILAEFGRLKAIEEKYEAIKSSSEDLPV